MTASLTGWVDSPAQHLEELEKAWDPTEEDAGAQLAPSIFIFNLGLQCIGNAATHIDWVFPAQLKFP